MCWECVNAQNDAAITIFPSNDCQSAARPSLRSVYERDARDRDTWKRGPGSAIIPTVPCNLLPLLRGVVRV